VVLAARRAGRLQAVTENIGTSQPGGGAVRWVPCDVTDDAARVRLVEVAASLTETVDVLVNTAGTVEEGDGLIESLDGLRRLRETNLFAMYKLCQLTVGHVPAGAGGSIVNVTSINAFRSEDRYPLAGYVASKAGVVG
jgi:NAD(P)-dependent dehydrogenase (short-subunit alcohol dehydrogenase family)